MAEQQSGSRNILRQFRDKKTREFQTISADQFMKVWNHYDENGDGYIDDKELDSFLRELVGSINASDVGPEQDLWVVGEVLTSETWITMLPDDSMFLLEHQVIQVEELRSNQVALPSDETLKWSLLVYRDSYTLELFRAPDVICETAMQNAKDQILAAFDHNKDGKIDFVELADILPTEENFLLLFRRDNPLESSVEFMKIWRKFDTDNSGYIEADELRNFLRHIIQITKGDEAAIDDERLTSYTGNVLQLFDKNKDGKLQLSEMAKLLPVKENFLCKPIFKKLRGKVKDLIGKEAQSVSGGTNKLTDEDIKRVFRLYDRDGNGCIENVELDGFLKDLMELIETDYTDGDLFECKQVLLEKCDLNHDGKINMDELTMILMSYPDSDEKA